MNKLLIVCAIFISSRLYAEAIEDNSFLIEEAYNQEPGVVQFINVFKENRKTKDWDYTFINEFPVIFQTHQFSYEVPIGHIDETKKTQNGDVKFNYRNELFRSDKIVTTGRISLFTPTGNTKNGFGNGDFAPELSLISSVKISDKWVQHWNIGGAKHWNAKDSTGAAAENTNYFMGLSNVILLTDKFNFMLETLFNSSQVTIGQKQTEWETNIVVSPSFRFAIDYRGWQFVPGVALPLGIGPNNKGQTELLGYLSIEGKLF